MLHLKIDSFYIDSVESLAYFKSKLDEFSHFTTLTE
jgi:hypothetical protein